MSAPSPLLRPFAREAIRKALSNGDMERVRSHLDSIYTAAMERCAQLALPSPPPNICALHSCDMMIAFTAGNIDLDKARWGQSMCV